MNTLLSSTAGASFLSSFFSVLFWFLLTLRWFVGKAFQLLLFSVCGVVASLVKLDNQLRPLNSNGC